MLDERRQYVHLFKLPFCQLCTYCHTYKSSRTCHSGCCTLTLGIRKLLILLVQFTFILRRETSAHRFTEGRKSYIPSNTPPHAEKSWRTFPGLAHSGHTFPPYIQGFYLTGAKSASSALRRMQCHRQSNLIYNLMIIRAEQELLCFVLTVCCFCYCCFNWLLFSVVCLVGWMLAFVLVLHHFQSFSLDILSVP